MWRNPEKSKSNIIRTRHVTKLTGVKLASQRNRGGENFKWYWQVFYFVGKAVLAPFILLYKACYYTGYWIFSMFSSLLSTVGAELAETGHLFRLRYRISREPQFRAALGSFVLLALFSLAGIRSFQLIAYGQQLKARVLGVATRGGGHLLEAKNAIQAQNFERAQNEFVLAQQSFQTSSRELEQANTAINSLMNLIPQKRDAQNLLDASVLISKAGSELVNFQKEISKLKFTQSGIESSGEPNSEVIGNMYHRVSNAWFAVAQAEQRISEVDSNNIPEHYRSQVSFLKDNLRFLNASLGSLKDMFGLVKNSLLGQKRILFVFQNNNELRATGGFMGTYGSALLQDGKIENLRISSIYDLDGQLSEKILPPTPILNVNNRWYMRDSNWFADFRASAKKITGFYEKEGGETPDLVVAITTEVVVDLLKLTGPIEMEHYDITLTHENFIETTQVATAMREDTPENAPKQLLADFFPILMQKVSELDAVQTPALLETFTQNFTEKHIVIHSGDREVQKQLESYNWAGAMVESDRDYLAVLSSNLGGTKTDKYVSQTIGLLSSIDIDGSVTNTVIIKRKNLLPRMEKSNNESFLRIYVPLGSELVSSEGFDYKNLDVNSLDLNGYRTDALVKEWEKNSVRNMVTGTVIGKESGKTFFGNWLNVQGGEEKTVKLVYRLPFKLKDTDRLSLTVQKQMGAMNFPFAYYVEFAGRKIEWKNFDTTELNIDSFKTEMLLNRDYFLGLVLTKGN